MGTVKDLTVYKKGFAVAMQIFESSKMFPTEEKYSLTDQIRRSSLAVCANIAEAYRKRQYSAYFLSRISDADMENTETQTWLEFALACKYLKEETYKNILTQSEEVGKLLAHMLTHPDNYIFNKTIN